MGCDWSVRFIYGSSTARVAACARARARAFAASFILVARGLTLVVFVATLLALVLLGVAIGELVVDEAVQRDDGAHESANVHHLERVVVPDGER